MGQHEVTVLNQSPVNVVIEVMAEESLQTKPIRAGGAEGFFKQVTDYFIVPDNEGNMIFLQSIALPTTPLL